MQLQNINRLAPSVRQLSTSRVFQSGAVTKGEVHPGFKALKNVQAEYQVIKKYLITIVYLTDFYRTNPET